MKSQIAIILFVSMSSTGLVSCGKKATPPEVSTDAVTSNTPLAATESETQASDASSEAQAATQVKVLASSDTMSCEDAARLVANPPSSPTKSDLFANAAAMTKQQSCLLAEYNARTEGAKVVAVGNVSKDKFEFEVVEVDPEAAEYKAACAAIAAAALEQGVQSAAVEAAGVVLAGAYAGGVACPAYVEAALRADPVLIVAPDFVAARYVTKEALEELAVYDDAKKLGKEARQFIRENPEQAALILSAPATVAAITIAENSEEYAQRADRDGIDILRGKRKLW